MKARVGMIIVVGLSLWLALSARAENTMLIGGQQVPLGPVGARESGVVPKSGPAPQAFAAAGQSRSTTVFRDVPSVSGRYSVGGTTLLPYVGAGFNSGYASDLDRSLHTVPSSQTDTNLRNLFGQNLAPSEFQMGVRIPF